MLNQSVSISCPCYSHLPSLRALDGDTIWYARERLLLVRKSIHQCSKWNQSPKEKRARRSLKRPRCGGVAASARPSVRPRAGLVLWLSSLPQHRPLARTHAASGLGCCCRRTNSGGRREERRGEPGNRDGEGGREEGEQSCCCCC